MLEWLASMCGDRILITSVVTSFDGTPRSGSSHPNGWAIDVTFPDRLSPGINPHFENDIYLMTHLAHFLKGPIMIAFESDHLHIEMSSLLSGVYRYPNSRPSFYSNDELQQPRVNADSELWKATRTSITLMPDSKLINEQRRTTEKKLDPRRLDTHLRAMFKVNHPLP